MASHRRRGSQKPGAAVSVRDLGPAELARLETMLRETVLREIQARKGPGQAVQQWQPNGPAAAAYAKTHRAPLLAAASVGGADLAVLAAHVAGWPGGYIAIAAATVAAGGRAAWTHRGKAKRRKRARRWAGAAWAAGSATAVAGTWAGMASGPGQLVMLGGGLALAAPYLWHNRQRTREDHPQDEDPQQPAPPPPTDPRIEAFLDRFCRRAGPCKGAELHSVRDIPDGFAFGLTLAEGVDATTADVIALGPKIAALYDVPADQVSVEYPPTRSERRAIISVLTVANAFSREDRWDGRSTYDPARGTIRIGRYADSTPAHWLLHKPGSGAASGVIAGVQGAGKTGTLLVIACEAGQVRLCAVCGAAGTCARCEMRRIVALWMADPQMQPLSVFRGRADLMAWGPYATAHMIVMTRVGMRARAAHLGSLAWRDHLGRENTGLGFFDPAPGRPLIKGIVDEWPLVIAEPDLAKIVIPPAASVLKEGRKVGAGLDFLTQMPDLTQLGDRAIRELLKAFNALSHRTDGLSKHMMGIQGDTTKLAPGLHGVGYLNGPDARPGAVMRTKHLPEYLKPGETGVDARELAGRIASEPVELDEAFVNAVTPLGYTGPGQILDDEPFQEALALMVKAARAGRPLAVEDALRRVVAGDTRQPPAAGLPAPAPAAPAAAAPAAIPGPPPGDVAVPLPLLAHVLAERGEMDLWDVSAAAGIDALAADTALRLLVDAGQAIQVAPGRYRTTLRPAPTPAAPVPAGSVPPAGPELLLQAAELVITTRFGSVSMLQRKLRIGYTHASGLMDQLQRHGIVGPADGTQPHDVLIGPAGLAAALSNLSHLTQTSL